MPAAQSRSQFLSQVRASFSPKSVASVGAITDQVAAITPAAPVVTDSTGVSLTDQLTILDNAITQAETAAAAKVVSQPLASVIPQPAATPILPVAPEPTPTWDPMATVMPTVIDQSTQTLNPVAPTTTVKEVAPAAQLATEQPLASMTESTAGNTVVESAPMGSYQEVGPVSPEIPPEIEAYLQEVKDHHQQQPHEIVMAHESLSLPMTSQPLRPVVVLPITPQTEKQGAHKNPSFSIRWLVEWSHRLMKMFTGKIIYQQTEAE